MLIRFISNYTPLKTAAVLVALVMGVISSRADHFLWSDFDTTVNAPPGTNGSDANWQWDYGSSYSLNEVGGYEGACSWGDSVTSQGWFDDAPTWDSAISGGHMFYIAASIDSEITGDWVSDQDGPPTNATVYYSATIDGAVEAQVLVRQLIDPANGDPGAVTNFAAGAGAGVEYSLITDNLPTFGDQVLAISGGITNGASGSGGASYSGPAEITPQSYTLVHTVREDIGEEKWQWEQYVTCWLSVSDSYPLPVDSVSASAHLESIATDDFAISTAVTTSYRTYAYADSYAGITGNFYYSVYGNY